MAMALGLAGLSSAEGKKGTSLFGFPAPSAPGKAPLRSEKPGQGTPLSFAQILQKDGPFKLEELENGLELTGMEPGEEGAPLSQNLLLLYTMVDAPNLLERLMKKMESQPGFLPGASQMFEAQSIFPPVFADKGLQLFAPGKGGNGPDRLWQQLTAVLSPLEDAALLSDLKQQLSGKTLPDAIYFKAPDPGGEKSLRVVFIQAKGGEDSLQLLQDWLAEAEARKGGIEGGARSESLPQELASFLHQRLNVEKVASTRGIQVETGLTESASVSAVKQAQAAMADMVEKLRGNLRLDPGNMRAVMHLDPPSLGRLHIHLRLVDNQNIEAHVGSENGETQDFLKQHQQDLKQGFQDQGFDGEQVEIHFDEEEMDWA